MRIANPIVKCAAWDGRTAGSADIRSKQTTMKVASAAAAVPTSAVEAAVAATLAEMA